VLVVPVIEAIDESSMASWIDVSVDCHFSLHNLPYGVLSPPGSTARIGTAIGEYALDLKCLAGAHIFDNIGFNVEVLQDVDTNRYAALRKPVHLKVPRIGCTSAAKSHRFGCGNGIANPRSAIDGEHNS
jgi:hypothetical protein